MHPEELLYRSQTIGNIEPIEYMIPYPSTQALIEGQTLKFGDQIIYEYAIDTKKLSSIFKIPSSSEMTIRFINDKNKK